MIMICVLFYFNGQSQTHITKVPKNFDLLINEQTNEKINKQISRVYRRKYSRIRYELSFKVKTITKLC